MKININEINVGDIFSEESHYVVLDKEKESIKFKHLESGCTVSLANKYVSDLLNTSDQYEKEVKVSREDKKDGTPGIRSIFEGIKSSEVFTVVFTKQGKSKTKKAFEQEKDEQRLRAIEVINKAKRNKKSMSEAYILALQEVQNNPIQPFIEGEERILRGFKKQFISRDGKYKCQDMDIDKTEKETGERLVNINTISQLIFNGVRYIVE